MGIQTNTFIENGERHSDVFGLTNAFTAGTPFWGFEVLKGLRSPVILKVFEPKGGTPLS